MAIRTWINPTRTSNGIHLPGFKTLRQHWKLIGNFLKMLTNINQQVWATADLFVWLKNYVQVFQLHYIIVSTKAKLLWDKQTAYQTFKNEPTILDFEHFHEKNLKTIFFLWQEVGSFRDTTITIRWIQDHFKRYLRNEEFTVTSNTIEKHGNKKYNPTNNLKILYICRAAFVTQ